MKSLMNVGLPLPLALVVVLALDACAPTRRPADHDARVQMEVGGDTASIVDGVVVPDGGADTLPADVSDDAAEVSDLGAPEVVESDRAPEDSVDAAMDVGVETAGPDSTTACPANPDGIVSWWHGESDYADAVGANPATSAGGVAFAGGAIGRGFWFDGGTDSYILVTNEEPFDIVGPLTIDAWINPSTANGRIVDKVAVGGTNGYLLDLLQGRLRIITGNESLSSSTVISPGTFTHVVGTYNGNSLALYIDGVLTATKAVTSTSIPTNSLPLRIGADANGTSLFAGIIDELRIFRRALSMTEVQAIYQQGSPAHCDCIAPPAGLVSWWRGEGAFTDAHGANMGENAGGVAFETGAVGSGFNLNGGASSYVLVPDSASLAFIDALTIEAWIKPMTLGRRIVDKIAPGGLAGYLLDTNAGRLRFSIGLDSVESNDTALLVTGGFSHVAGVYDGATLTVYVNGVQVATKATSVTAVGTNALPLRIGADSNGESRFVGVIDEVRIYDRALSRPEIAAIAGAGASARCP